MGKHERHPDCLAELPVDSCHWPGCENGVSSEGQKCYHSECPVCRHSLQLHDGAGCFGGDTDACACPVQMNMPDSAPTLGHDFRKRIETPA